MSSINNQDRHPPLKALVLAGGRSRRMGMDKARLTYHNGEEQEVHVAQLCRSLGLETYISKASSWEGTTLGEFRVIKDIHTDIGPLGALLAAFEHAETSAWLVVACDLPLISTDTLQSLLLHRNTDLAATAYTHSDNLPEPLLAIYEPSIHQALKVAYGSGNYSPRYLLQHQEIHMLPTHDPSTLSNANTPEEYERLKAVIGGGLEQKRNS